MYEALRVCGLGLALAMISMSLALRVSALGLGHGLMFVVLAVALTLGLNNTKPVSEPTEGNLEHLTPARETHPLASSFLDPLLRSSRKGRC